MKTDISLATWYGTFMFSLYFTLHYFFFFFYVLLFLSSLFASFIFNAHMINTYMLVASCLLLSSGSRALHCNFFYYKIPTSFFPSLFSISDVMIIHRKTSATYMDWLRLFDERNSTIFLKFQRQFHWKGEIKEKPIETLLTDCFHIHMWVCVNRRISMGVPH